jgi:hypothetical protein
VNARTGASIVCIVLAMTGCSSADRGASRASRSGADASQSSPLVHEDFSGLSFGLSFDHPAEWTSQPFEMASSFSRLITYLSQTQLSDPCTNTSAPGGLGTSCSRPVTQLEPGSVLVTWSTVGAHRRSDGSLRRSLRYSARSSDCE